MKTILKKRENGTIRISYDYSDEKLITDQAAANELTMASIVKKLEKGILPVLAQNLSYSNDLGLRSFQDVFERKELVQKLYDQLPVEIKQKMGNNIKNFDNVIFDESNTELLLKHGLLVQTKDKHKELIAAINAIKPTPDDQK